MLGLDANIFLEVELAQERAEECLDLLEKIKDGLITASVSDFTVDGIVLIMEQKGKDWKSIRKFLLSLFQYQGLIIYKSTTADKIAATDHMAAYSLDFEDSLTLQCALANNCSALVSFDKDFNSVKEIKRITPAEALRE